MDYMSTDFGADSLIPFPFRARKKDKQSLTNRQTDRRDWTPYDIPAAIQPAWVNICVITLTFYVLQHSIFEIKQR